MTRKYESTAVMLRPDQLERLREIRDVTHMPMSVMHRQAVDEWIARWDRDAARGADGTTPRESEERSR